MLQARQREAMERVVRHGLLDGGEDRPRDRCALEHPLRFHQMDSVAPRLQDTHYKSLRKDLLGTGTSARHKQQIR